MFKKAYEKAHPGEEVPLNIGKPWTPSEKSQLLDEFKEGLPIDQIATRHGRTAGSIRSRLEDIAVEMYSSKVSEVEIYQKTGVTLGKVIERMQKKSKTAKPSDSILEEVVSQTDNELVLIKNEIGALRSELYELKKMSKEIVDMLKAVYEFEDV